MLYFTKSNKLYFDLLERRKHQQEKKMKFKLSELLQYDNIVIQCHDNPDADTLASGFALKKYFERKGKTSRLIYSGKTEITKSNLLLMKETLNIPVEYVKELETPDLLVTVDCQYGEKNVTHFEAKEVAVIDHHQISTTVPPLSEVRSNYGSCSTVFFKLLEDEGIDINEDQDLATALYYGLFTDTGSLAEISHPADKDLRDHAKYKIRDVLSFRNSNLSKEELQIAGEALESAYYDEIHPYGIIEAKPCDPNILGVISDMFLEVENLETCLVYSILPFGVKISVRSCSVNVKADELAGYLTQGLGGGGGHLTKAGGLLQKDLFPRKGIPYESDDIRDLMRERMHSYYEGSEIRYAGKETEDITGYERYEKVEVPLGFVEAKSLAPCGTKILVRTLEGDIEFRIEEDIYIIIGIDGEIYPCRKDKFERSYRYCDDPYVYPGEYEPVVLATDHSDSIKLLPFARSCIALGGSYIFAKELDHRLKIFTSWDPEKYYLGVKGDFLGVRPDDHTDFYIIARRIFDKTYRKCVNADESD